MDKNNFLLYKDFKSTIDILTDEQAGKLIKGVFSYVNGRIEPNFTDGMLIVAFNVLKAQLERDLVKYKVIVERNQTNGAKGGRPKNNPDEKEKPKKPSGLNGNPKNPSEPKKADSDSDSVRDSDIDKKNMKHKYGEFKNVLLTNDEYEKIKTSFTDYNEKIENLSMYIKSKGAKYKSHYATILNWSRKENKTEVKEREFLGDVL